MLGVHEITQIVSHVKLVKKQTNKLPSISIPRHVCKNNLTVMSSNAVWLT